MRNLKFLPNILMCCLLVLFLGCATTKITSIWKDSAFSANKLGKVMVVGVAEEEGARRVFEDAFVLQLRNKNVDAISSYNKFSLEEIQNNKDSVNVLMQQEAVNTVIVTRMIDRKTEQVYYPPDYHTPSTTYRHGWHDYYSTGYATMISPGYFETYDIVKLETNVYDAQSDKLLWSGLSESSFEKGAGSQKIGEVVEKVITALLK